jgi:hypothetical protein
VNRDTKLPDILGSQVVPHGILSWLLDVQARLRIRSPDDKQFRGKNRGIHGRLLRKKHGRNSNDEKTAEYESDRRFHSTPEMT